ncbi:6-phosphogluconolactonase [Hydrogenobacter thermophilus]|uniref:6-phosphogluconolactonase n=1 Tax=Hydrogenobacter thermophilus TaxID=940 RepID=UPI0030FB55A5
MYKLYSLEDPDLKLKTFLKRLINLFLKHQKVCHIALAGGRTPIELYRMLSKENLLWGKIKFYLTDERYVSLVSELSNYKAVRETLGDKAKLVFYKTDMDIEECALDYSLQLPERLHITLLGVGKDGHTASLFPKGECKKVSQKVCVSRSPDGLLRLSLTQEYLNGSCVIIFFVKGEEKKKILEAMLRREDIPAVKVRGVLRTYLFTDISGL